MKKIFALIAMVASCTAMAETTTASNAGPIGQDTKVNTESSAVASNGGQSLTYAPVYQTPADTTAVVTQNVTGTQTQIVQGGTNSTVHQTFGTQTIKNTPSVSGAPLTSSNDTCMGSASGSANVPGIGLSFGKTYTDDNCVMLKNSRELWNMGMKAASMALMCMDKNNRTALELTGFTCPQNEKRATTTKLGEETDPYIRARMGLPALSN
jgi:hypothetical protein